MVKELINKLNQYFSKVLYEREREFYVFTLFRNSEKTYLLCVDRTTDEYIYGKITSLSSLTIIDCWESLYNPYGLFIFAKDLDEFVNKLINKIDLLKH